MISTKSLSVESDKCRKWDHAFVCSRFGDVRGVSPVDSRYGFHPHRLSVIDSFRRIVEHGTFGCHLVLTNSTAQSSATGANVIRLRWKNHQIHVDLRLAVSTLPAIQACCRPG